MADRQLQLAGSVRHRFSGRVVIRWVGADGTPLSVSGTSVDVSVYGLGVVIPVRIPVDTEVTVLLNGVAVCGGAQVRHSQSCPDGFSMGLQFSQALFMQNIPGLDEILVGSFYSASDAFKAPGAPLIQRLRARLLRALMAKS